MDSQKQVCEVNLRARILLNAEEVYDTLTSSFFIASVHESVTAAATL
jgi:hypothetical protein